jgi:hypothetical protein
MTYYCDSSAVVKVYLEEAGSTYMENLYDQAPIGNIFINAIAGPEVLSAMHRRFRSGDLSSEAISQARQDFMEDFQHFFNRIPVSDPIIALAMQLIERHPLRGYDSVQLATAIHLQSIFSAFDGEEVYFVGSDRVLNNAARSEGLTVINPAEQP